MFSKGSRRRAALRFAGIAFVVGLMMSAVPAQGLTYGTADTAHPFVGAIVVQADAG